MVTNNPEQVKQDLDSVYAWIETQPNVSTNRTGIVGFCFGGRASLNYSLHNDQLPATVIFYGSPITDSQVLRSLPGSVLGIFGGAYNSVPTDEVRAFEAALNQAGIPSEITLYDGPPHAFVTDIESISSGGVQCRAWAHMLDFFEKSLKQGGASQNPVPYRAYVQPFDWECYLLLVYEHAFGTAGHHRLKDCRRK